MPKIPVYETQVQYRPALGDPGAVAAGGERIAKGVSGLLDSLGDFADAQRKAREASELSSLNLEAAKGIGELELELDKDTDYQTVPQKFDERTKAMRDDLLGRATSSTVKTTFQREFDKLVISKGLSIKRDAFKREVDSGVADLDSNLDLYAGLAARARNDIEREDIIGMARLEIERKAEAGFITRESAGKRERTFLAKLDEAAILGEITTQPERALDRLSDPKQLPNLDEVARSRLIDTTTRRIDTLTRERAAQAERRDRLVEKELKRAADEKEKEGWGLWADGKLSREWIDGAKSTLGANQYEAFVRASRGDGPETDDRDAYADLQRLLHSSNPAAAESVAYRYHKAGLIKNATLSGTVEKVRSFSRQEGPKSEYERSRAYIVDRLAPSEATQDPTPRARLGEAVDMFDRWVNEKPRTDKEIEEKGREIADRFVFVDLSQMKLSIPLPRSYAGTRSTVTIDAISAAEDKLVTDKDAGLLGDDEYRREARILDQWRRVLEREAANQKPGTKK